MRQPWYTATQKFEAAMQTYLFYDIETTGLNKTFDQVLQFAAIRTDLTLKELDRYEITVKLNRDIIPSPYALITHHIGINQTRESLNEYAAIQKIHQCMNQPGTISLGYNTLGFDDEFLRFSFYRNLLPPYTHQFANQCSRMDLYPMTVMYYLFKPNVLRWPQLEGEISLKLEQLSLANQLASGRAHDAMVDVEATLALTKYFIQEKEMWEYLKGYFNKKIDEERIKPLKNDIALMIDSKLKKHAFQMPVLYLGHHRYYKNQIVWLHLDSPDLMQTTLENIAEKTRSTFKKMGEPNFILPLKDRFMTHLKQERLNIAKENATWLTNHPEIFNAIAAYHMEYQYPQVPNTDIEASLYLNGFYSYEEEQFCQAFHKSAHEDKSKLLDRANHLKPSALALRIMGRHFPELLSSAQAAQFNEYLQQINQDLIIDFKNNKKLSPQVALQEIESIRLKNTSLSHEQQSLLAELENHLLSFS